MGTEDEHFGPQLQECKDSVMGGLCRVLSCWCPHWVLPRPWGVRGHDSLGTAGGSWKRDFSSNLGYSMVL